MLQLRLLENIFCHEFFILSVLVLASIEIFFISCFSLSRFLYSFSFILIMYTYLYKHNDIEELLGTF